MSKYNNENIYWVVAANGDLGTGASYKPDHKGDASITKQSDKNYTLLLRPTVKTNTNKDVEFDKKNIVHYKFEDLNKDNRIQSNLRIEQ